MGEGRTWRSKRPGRSSAGSRMSARLVAAMTMMPVLPSKPSISVSSCRRGQGAGRGGGVRGRWGFGGGGGGTTAACPALHADPGPGVMPAVCQPAQDPGAAHQARTLGLPTKPGPWGPGAGRQAGGRARTWFSVCSRSSLPPPMPVPRLRPTASISSTKMRQGAFSLAFLNRSRTRLAPTPTNICGRRRRGGRVSGTPRGARRGRRVPGSAHPSRAACCSPAASCAHPPPRTRNRRC